MGYCCSFGIGRKNHTFVFLWLCFLQADFSITGIDNTSFLVLLGANGYQKFYYITTRITFKVSFERPYLSLLEPVYLAENFFLPSLNWFVIALLKNVQCLVEMNSILQNMFYKSKKKSYYCMTFKVSVTKMYKNSRSYSILGIKYYHRLN